MASSHRWLASCRHGQVDAAAGGRRPRSVRVEQERFDPFAHHAGGRSASDTSRSVDRDDPTWVTSQFVQGHNL
jgi:hypothetical protein